MAIGVRLEGGYRCQVSSGLHCQAEVKSRETSSLHRNPDGKALMVRQTDFSASKNSRIDKSAHSIRMWHNPESLRGEKRCSKSSEVRPAERLQDLIDIHPGAYHLLPACASFFRPFSYINTSSNFIYIRYACASHSCWRWPLPRRHDNCMNFPVKGKTSINLSIGDPGRLN